MANITGNSGMEDYLLGGRKKNVPAYSFLEQFSSGVQPRGSNITGNVMDSIGITIIQCLLQIKYQKKY